MSIVINPDSEALTLLRKRAAMLAKIQSEHDPSGNLHPLCSELKDLTKIIQMRLGGLALDQAIALAK